MSTEVKYPEVVVRLTGENGNAMNIIGIVVREMKEAGVAKEKRNEYIGEATAGDYDNLLHVTMRWVTVE